MRQCKANCESLGEIQTCKNSLHPMCHTSDESKDGVVRRVSNRGSMQEVKFITEVDLEARRMC
jgi:hypothetical protein